ncbi:hypothetical protein MCNF_54850 [Mycolicibacterium confluentis]|uniref:Uncharacterized protein n=1 Tax=Mycolicibacterium confluentis TaxID=28047 RepID=A0A7I7Y5H9_9MYCO|nr:hypothetical protein MCNF_54850 [Mycolicibacterium confluentis]
MMWPHSPVAYLAKSRRRLTLNMVRASGDIDRLNAWALSDFAASPPEELARLMRPACLRRV